MNMCMQASKYSGALSRSSIHCILRANSLFKTAVFFDLGTRNRSDSISHVYTNIHSTYIGMDDIGFRVLGFHDSKMQAKVLASRVLFVTREIAARRARSFPASPKAQSCIVETWKYVEVTKFASTRPSPVASRHVFSHQGASRGCSLGGPKPPYIYWMIKHVPTPEKSKDNSMNDGTLESR